MAFLLMLLTDIYFLVCSHLHFVLLCILLYRPTASFYPAIGCNTNKIRMMRPNRRNLSKADLYVTNMACKVHVGY